MAGHDFNAFPELTNSQMQFYLWESPHEQITKDFEAKVVKVHDGDTITVETNFRDFDFPIRFANIQAPELNEGGDESRRWLENIVLNKNVQVKIDPTNRVGKFGRIIGDVFFNGFSINEESLRVGHSIPFGKSIGFFNFDKQLARFTI